MSQWFICFKSLLEAVYDAYSHTCGYQETAVPGEDLIMNHVISITLNPTILKVGYMSTYTLHNYTLYCFRQKINMNKISSVFLFELESIFQLCVKICEIWFLGNTKDGDTNRINLLPSNPWCTDDIWHHSVCFDNILSFCRDWSPWLVS